MTDDKPNDRTRQNENLFSSSAAVRLYTQRMKNERSLFPEEQKVIDRYFAESNASVLDVGCGAGRVSSLLAERGFDVTGIDVSQPLVETARSQFPEITFRVEDVRNTGFSSGSFEYVIFSWFGIDYVLPKSARLEAFAEIRRLLKPSGILVFSTHNSWYPLIPLSARDFACGVKDIIDLYIRRPNRERWGSPYKLERVTLGDVEIYLANPLHHWIQLRKCGFTPLDVIGKRDGPLRYFERQPHFVAKK